MHIKILRVTTRTKTRHNFKITEEKSQSNEKKKRKKDSSMVNGKHQIRCQNQTQAIQLSMI